MRIQCDVVDVSGRPAESPIIHVTLRTFGVDSPVEGSLNGHSFEVWAPVHRGDWHTLQIQASSADGATRASTAIPRSSLRAAARKKQTLTLQPSTRTVTINAIHEGSPVANAHISLQTIDGTTLETQCDSFGIAELRLLADEQIMSFTGWADGPLFGGFQFSRQPVRDEAAQSQTMELFRCRTQKFRVVDEHGAACPNVEMILQVATPPPDFNYLGIIDASKMVSDNKGEAFFSWFPDWDDVHCYVELVGDQWVIDGVSYWDNGDFIVPVKPRCGRQRATGKLHVNEGSKAGFHVSWRSFESEQEGRGDFKECATDRDGNFTADLLPGATYCVFVNDAQHVSDMIDLIPIPIDGSPPRPAVLQMQKAVMLSIRVTAGEHQRPLTNQAVYIRENHNYQWLVEGEPQSGSGARDRITYTDDHGIAKAVVESGRQVKVSIYNNDWKPSKELVIAPEQENTIHLHREFDQPRTVFGVVLQDDDHPVSFDDLTVFAGSVDGSTRDNKKLSVESNGVFRIQTTATAVGALAIDNGRSVAGVVTTDHPNRIMRLYLRPTQPVRGRLINAEGQPIVGRIVRASLRVKHVGENQALNKFYGFYISRMQVETDAEGYYTFQGMPVGVQLGLTVAVPMAEDHYLDTIELKDNEQLPVRVDTLAD